MDHGGNQIKAYITLTHAQGSYVPLAPGSRAITAKMAELMNDPSMGNIPGRYGPCQASVIEATAQTTHRPDPEIPVRSTLTLSFKPDAGYGKLGNIDRVMASSGHQLAPPGEEPPGYDPLYDTLQGA